MTGRPGGAPFRFWSAARSVVGVSAQKARRRAQPIARLLAPSLTRLTQDSCCAATSGLTQDSWTHYRTLLPGRRATKGGEQRACHRVRSCRRTECGRCSRESTRKRVMHTCLHCERAGRGGRLRRPLAHAGEWSAIRACRCEIVSIPRRSLPAVAEACGGIANVFSWRAISTDLLRDQVLEP